MLDSNININSVLHIIQPSSVSMKILETISCVRAGIDDVAKGGLTIFLELFTVIPSAPKYLKRLYHRYLKTFGSQIETEGSLKIEKLSYDSCLKTSRDNPCDNG